MKFKKIFLKAGVLAAVAAPTIAVVSCGDDGDDESGSLQSPLALDIKKFVDKKIPVDFEDGNIPKFDKAKKANGTYRAVKDFKKNDDVTEWFHSQASIDLIIGVNAKIIVHDTYDKATNSIKLNVELEYNGEKKTKIVTFTGSNYTEQGLRALNHLVKSMYNEFKSLYPEAKTSEKQFYPYGLDTGNLQKPSALDIYTSLRKGWWFLGAANGMGINANSYGKYKADKYVDRLDELFGYGKFAKKQKGTVKVDYTTNSITFPDYPDYTFYYDKTKVQPDATLRETMAYELLQKIKSINVYQIDTSTIKANANSPEIWITKIIEGIKNNEEFKKEKYDVVRASLLNFFYTVDPSAKLNTHDKTSLKKLVKDDAALKAFYKPAYDTKLKWDNMVDGWNTVGDAQTVVNSHWQINNFNKYTSGLKVVYSFANGKMTVKFNKTDFAGLKNTNHIITITNLTKAKADEVIDKLITPMLTMELPKDSKVDLTKADAAKTNEVIDEFLKAFNLKEKDEYKEIVYKVITDKLLDTFKKGAHITYDHSKKEVKVELTKLDGTKKTYTFKLSKKASA